MGHCGNTATSRISGPRGAAPRRIGAASAPRAKSRSSTKAPLWRIVATLPRRDASRTRRAGGRVVCVYDEHCHKPQALKVRSQPGPSIARTSASRPTAYSSSQQTAASHAAERLRGDVERAALEPGGVAGQDEIEVGHIDVCLVPVDQRDPIRGHADVARVVGVAVHDAGRTSCESCPRRPASGNAFGGHRPEVDLRAGLGVQEVSRRSPTRSLRPAPCQPVQLAERVGHPAPVVLRRGRTAVQVGHHHHTTGEQPTIRGRDRHRHRQTRTVEMLHEPGLPREISVASRTKPADCEPPVEAHAPDVVGDPTSQPFHASGVLTPLPERLPPHLRDPTGSSRRASRAAVD